jgi:inner membrane protein
MPSPIAHLAAGYLSYRIARPHAPEAGKTYGIPQLLVITAAFSLLPDLDSVAGLLLGSFGDYHNNATHSLLLGTALGVVFAAWMAWRGLGFAFWALVAVISYGLHVAMDAATVGRGVMAIWPLSDNRFLLPVTLFYGFHWTDGWLSIRHLWTLVTELAFAIVALLAWQTWSRRHHTGG